MCNDLVLCSRGNQCRWQSRTQDDQCAPRRMVAGPAGLVLLYALMVASAPDWTDCPMSCRCKWTSGKKSALCRDAGFTTIPDSLDSDMQVLDLTGNAIPYLTKDAFKSVGLLNLQRIFLKSTGVRELHRDAFKDLTILVEVDLSDNLIHTLHQETFSGNGRLRVLYLNGNPITELRSGQFPILPHLRTLELQHCQIRIIHRDAFLHLSALESLSLNGNRLKQISETVFLPVSKLKTLSLDGNPWRCDCELRGFRNWLLSSNLYPHPLLCTDPLILEGKHWEDVKPLEFACPPTVTLSETMVQQEAGGNATFRCQVRGDPEPTISWLFNGKSIGNGSVNQDQVLLIEEEDGDVMTEKWTTLSLMNVSDADAGEYTCVAKNLRGVAAANVSLLLPEVVIATTLSKSDPWLVWVVWLIFGATGVVFLSILSACAYRLKRCRSKKHRRKAKMKESVSFCDQEKKLLDVSIATSTDRPSGSCDGLGSQPDMELLEQSLQSLPLELCDQPVHITIESHAAEQSVVFPPPPEFSASLLPPGAFGNIFISVSVSQDPNLDSPRYPDLLDLPHRKSVSVAAGPDAPFFATLPRRQSQPRPPKKEVDPLLRVGPQYDNMGPRVTAGGSSTLSLPDSAAAEEIPTPPPPPICSPLTVDYVSL